MKRLNDLSKVTQLVRISEEKLGLTYKITGIFGFQKSHKQNQICIPGDSLFSIPIFYSGIEC